MGAQSIPRLITVEELERIPDPPGGRNELHHGEVVPVTYPVHEHKAMQRRLRKLLEQAGDSAGYVSDTEFPYRPFPEHEVWGADVACISGERYDAIDRWLIGSPELVIEVKSPSNTQAELRDKAMTTLAGNGAQEFWVVDLETRTVTVYSKDRGISLYRGKDARIAAPIRGGAFISLADIFADMA